MNTKSIIEIFRGDDSDALGYQTIVGTIHTDLDLTGCKAVFRYLGFFQEFDPIPEDKKLTIVIPSASSMQFPPGFGYASLKVYDIDRKVRTFTNRIPVFVKTMTPCIGGGEFDVEFSPFPELAPLKIFKGPNAEDFDLYTGFVSKIIDRASAEKYGLSILLDAMDAEKTAEGGCAASPAAVKAAYDAIIKELTDNYYTAEQTDEAIDKLAAYYITSDTQGNPFATHAALVNATTYYSGGSVRTPTRNDYAIVVADETHNNEEWRYIYSENEQGVGQWEPQYAVEGVITFDDNVTRTSGNGVKSSGIWSALWGSLAALPTGFTSLYDWVVSKLSEYRDKLDLNVYSFGNASVTFLRGYSITDGYVTYRSGGTGGVDETITFIGPVPSSNQYTPNDKYYYPSTLGTLESFDPDNYSVWCLVCTNGGTIPSYMMYKTGPYYNISSFNSETPTLTLGFGEATGDAPTMARPLGATGDTLAKVSQMNIALAGKANDNAVVKLTGNQEIAGNKTFSGEVNIDSLGGMLVISNSQDNGRVEFWCVYQSEETGCALEIWMYDGLGNNYRIKVPQKNGVLALLQNIAPNYSSQTTYAVNQLCVSNDVLKRCTTAGTGNAAVFTNATVEDVLAALRTAIAGKANRAANPTSGNLASLTAAGGIQDAGYHFEVRNGIPCIVQYT